MAALVLFVAAAFFGYLAVDAHRMGQPSHETPYEIEAKARGEAVDGVSLTEQQKRRAWYLQYEIGRVSDVVWLWSILAASCLVAALFEVSG